MNIDDNINNNPYFEIEKSLKKADAKHKEAMVLVSKCKESATPVDLAWIAVREAAINAAFASYCQNMEALILEIDEIISSAFFNAKMAGILPTSE